MVQYVKENCIHVDNKRMKLYRQLQKKFKQQIYQLRVWYKRLEIESRWKKAVILKKFIILKWIWSWHIPIIQLNCNEVIICLSFCLIFIEISNYFTVNFKTYCVWLLMSKFYFPLRKFHFLKIFRNCFKILFDQRSVKKIHNIEIISLFCKLYHKV